MRIKNKIKKFLLLNFISSLLFAENFKISYDVYMKFPCWIKVGKARFEENNNCLEGKIELNGILKLIARNYEYKTIYENGEIEYWEGNKMYKLEKEYDVLSIIKKLKKDIEKEKDFKINLTVFIKNEYRELRIEKEMDKIKIYGLPLINKVVGKINKKIPEELETSVYGIKFKGILNEY